MDILSRVYKNPELTEISSEKILILQKEYDGSQKINIKSSMGEEYSLLELVYMVKHRDIPIGDYLKNCMSLRISVIGYIERQKILDDIKKYIKKTDVPGYFISDTGTDCHRIYKMPIITDYYYLIVPRDKNSIVSIKTILRLLNVNSISSKNQHVIGFQIKKYKIIVADNIEDLDPASWRLFVGVFIHNFEKEFRNTKEDFQKIYGTIPLFSFEKINGLETHIFTVNSEKKIVERDMIFDEIYRSIERFR